jgi:hypothetical protein
MTKIIDRFILQELKYLMKNSAIILITGPRKVAKHQIVEKLIDQNYIKLDMENDDIYDFVTTNPRAFLRSAPPNILITNIDRANNLLNCFPPFISDLRAKYRGYLPNIFLLVSSFPSFEIIDFAASFQINARVININPLLAAEIIPLGDINFLHNLFNRENYDNYIKSNYDLSDVAINATFPYLLTGAKQTHKEFFDKIIFESIDKYFDNQTSKDKFIVFIKLLGAEIGNLINERDICKKIELTKDEYTSFIKLAKIMKVFIFLDQWFTGQERKLSELIFVIDTNLSLYLRGESKLTANINEERLLRNFICSEIYKQTNIKPEYKLYHFQKYEDCPVDFIIENQLNAEIVAVNIVWNENIDDEDIAKIMKFKSHAAQLCKKAFILYKGDKVVKYKNNVTALPIASLWYSGEV